MLLSIFLGLLLFGFGILAFLKPDIIWKVTEQWKSYSADEPSDLYLFSTKFGGVLFILVGIAAVLLPMILK